eukprot:6273397-Prymnesium_polylepis.1
MQEALHGCRRACRARMRNRELLHGHGQAGIYLCGAFRRGLPARRHGRALHDKVIFAHAPVVPLEAADLPEEEERSSVLTDGIAQ